MKLELALLKRICTSTIHHRLGEVALRQYRSFGNLLNVAVQQLKSSMGMVK